MSPTCWCGSAEYVPVSEGTWCRGGVPAPIPFRVASCRSCDLARTLPVPEESRYHRGGSNWAAAHTSDTWSAGIARDLIAKARGTRILDVGCSVGNMVAAARSLGADPEGIDLDPVAVPRGQCLGRNVHNRNIADQGGVWDGINLNHVLEHIVDLRPFLEHIGRLAGPNTALMIRVPHYRGLIPRLMGDNWFAWAPDEHVWHFTPKTLVTVVEACTPLRCVEARARGRIEPTSPGLKGVAKNFLAVAGDRAGHGDQVEAHFTMPATGDLPVSIAAPTRVQPPGHSV